MASESTINEPKGQHYVPRFYLKGFTDKNKVLWVCEKFKPIRPSKPKCEAHRPDYYTVLRNGERDERGEAILKDVESKAAPIIRKLASRQYVLTPENASHLIIFVAFMFGRVPSWRENLMNLAKKIARDIHVRTASDREKFHKLCQDFEKSAGKPLGLDVEEFRQEILRGEYDIVPSDGFNLGSMFKSILTVLGLLKEFGYQGLYAPEGIYFLTSDAPVFTLLPDGGGEATVGAGFGWPNIEVYFPLNKRVCLKLRRGIEPLGMEISPKYAEAINRLVMATATRYLYSSEGYRRIARLFDERGCKVQPGRDAFMMTPPPQGYRTLF